MENKVKHVIWDWNGTLTDDLTVTVDILNTMLEQRELPLITNEYYQSIYTHPISKIYEKLNFNFEQEDFESLSLEWHKQYEESLANLNLHSGAINILEKFSNKNISQSVLSAMSHDFLIDSINKRGISKFFSNILGLDNIYAKSKIENGLKLIKEIETSSNNIILIGDSSHDFETANALSIRCFLVARGLESKSRLLKLDVPVFDNFEDLYQEIEFLF